MDRLSLAFEATPRINFLPEDVRNEAELDTPLSIGYGQTNSQPYTVRLMLEWLDARPGQKVLDVGSGSGWTTAILSHLVSPKGRVIAVERVPELVKFGAENCKRLKIKNVEFHEAGKEYGWPAEGPYDRILVSAAAEKLPPELVGQLASPGRMVIPIRASVHVISKDINGKLETEEHPGFAFVPLV